MSALGNLQCSGIARYAKNITFVIALMALLHCWNTQMCFRRHRSIPAWSCSRDFLGKVNKGYTGVSQVMSVCVGEGAGRQKKEHSSFRRKVCSSLDIPNMNYLLGNQFGHMDSQVIAQGRSPELRDSGWNQETGWDDLERVCEAEGQWHAMWHRCSWASEMDLTEENKWMLVTRAAKSTKSAVRTGERRVGEGGERPVDWSLTEMHHEIRTANVC